MKALQVDFSKEDDVISTVEGRVEEDWIGVCERFENDVHRLRDVSGQPPFTGLYACYDEDNNPFYYLVEETPRLNRMRHKVFLNKLGRS